MSRYNVNSKFLTKTHTHMDKGRVVPRESLMMPQSCLLRKGLAAWRLCRELSMVLNETVHLGFWRVECPDKHLSFSISKGNTTYLKLQIDL